MSSSALQSCDGQFLTIFKYFIDKKITWKKKTVCQLITALERTKGKLPDTQTPVQLHESNHIILSQHNICHLLHNPYMHIHLVTT